MASSSLKNIGSVSLLSTSTPKFMKKQYKILNYAPQFSSFVHFLPTTLFMLFLEQHTNFSISHDIPRITWLKSTILLSMKFFGKTPCSQTLHLKKIIIPWISRIHSSPDRHRILLHLAPSHPCLHHSHPVLSLTDHANNASLRSCFNH